MGTKIINCILCHNEYSLTGKPPEKSNLNLVHSLAGDSDGNNALKNQLEVIFLLRKILEIPQDVCCTFLEYYGDPCSWIDCCDSCSVLIQTSKHIFDQVIMLQKQFKTLQNQITNQIKLAVSYEVNLADEVKSGVRDTIRSFFNQGVSIVVKEENIEAELSSSQPSDLTTKESSRLAGTTCNTNTDVDKQPFIKTEVDSCDCAYPLDEFLNGADGYSEEQADPLGPDETVEANANRGQVYTGHSFPFYQLTSHPEPEFQSEESPSLNVPTSSWDFNNECSEEQKVSSLLFNPPPMEERNHVFPENVKGEENNFKCNICGKCFTRKYTLKRHEVLVHKSDEKPFKCDICGKAYRTSKHLYGHRRQHGKKKQHKCKFCPSRFTEFGALRLHYQEAHTGQKPFECAICGKVLFQSSDLGRHMKIHTGDRRYQCSVCEKAFFQSSDLGRHLTLHTGKKPL